MSKQTSLAAIPLKPGVNGIGWPAIPNPATALAWTLQQQLDASQWWSPEVIRARQLEQLRRVVAHARATVPWYRERDGATGRTRATPANWDEWRELPVLSRADVQSAGDALNSTRLPRSHGATSLVITTGSTGRPIRVQTTQVTALFWHAFTFREHLWQRRDFRAKLGAIRILGGDTATPPDGLRIANWGPSTAPLVDTGPAVALSVDKSTLDEQWLWLQREQPQYLLTFPSVAEALARRCLETGASLAGLRELRTLGEALPAGLRDLVREAWGVPLADMYTAQEVGNIALQCPGHEHYHVQSENLLVEVLDDDGEPCAPGQIGHVVLSSLHNFATPLLRYAIGDYAEAGEPCPCGRGLPVLKRIQGRVRNMLRLPDGTTRWPILGQFIPELERLPPVRQYQLVQKSIERIEAQIAVTQPLTAEQEAILIAMWQRSLGHPFEISINYVDTIPRGTGGKFEEFRSEIE